jgi:pSer/pThr/pTyr-binding forkhead associated (FHA) protein
VNERERLGLKVISGVSPGSLFSLENGTNTIGRHSLNSVCLGAEGLVVSKKHATITIAADAAVFIEDCGSTNGIYVNDSKTGRSELTVGDVIGFGESGPRLQLIRIATDGAINSYALPEESGRVADGQAPSSATAFRAEAPGGFRSRRCRYPGAHKRIMGLSSLADSRWECAEGHKGEAYASPLFHRRNRAMAFQQPDGRRHGGGLFINKYARGIPPQMPKSL